MKAGGGGHGVSVGRQGIAAGKARPGNADEREGAGGEARGYATCTQARRRRPFPFTLSRASSGTPTAEEWMCSCPGPSMAHSPPARRRARTCADDVRCVGTGPQHAAHTPRSYAQRNSSRRAAWSVGAVASRSSLGSPSGGGRRVPLSTRGGSVDRRMGRRSRRLRPLTGAAGRLRACRTSSMSPSLKTRAIARPPACSAPLSAVCLGP